LNYLSIYLSIYLFNDISNNSSISSAKQRQMTPVLWNQLLKAITFNAG